MGRKVIQMDEENKLTPRRSGRPRRPPGQGRVHATVRLVPAIHQQLRDEAAKHSRSLSEEMETRLAHTLIGSIFLRVEDAVGRRLEQSEHIVRQLRDQVLAALADERAARIAELERQLAERDRRLAEADQQRRALIEVIRGDRS
jgi:hypothetical protein